MLTLEPEDYARLFPKITQVISSIQGTFVLCEDGRVYATGLNTEGATGLNTEGRLGLGDCKDRNVFTQVRMSSDKKIKQIFIDYYGRTFALCEDGCLYATDSTIFEKWLVDTKNKYVFTRVIMPDSQKIKQIFTDSGWNLIFALFEDGCVYALGSNKFGQLGQLDLGQLLQLGELGRGLYDFLSENTMKFTRLVMPSDKKIKQIFVGEFSTFALFEEGCVYATGLNNKGQLGLGEGYDQKINVFTLVKMPSDKKIKQIFVGLFSTFALFEEGCVYATGLNNVGQLGLGDNQHQSNFTLVTSLNDKKIKQILIDSVFSTFALSEDGCVYATGLNDAGQLGMGDRQNRNVFTLVTMPKNRKIKQIFAGLPSNFALCEDGCLYATGLNDKGQLGMGHDAIINTFTPVVSLKDNKITQLVRTTMKKNENISMINFALSEDGVLFVMGESEQGITGLPYITGFSPPITRFIRVSIPFEDASIVISVERIFPKVMPLPIAYSAEGAGHIDAHKLLGGVAPFLGL